MGLIEGPQGLVAGEIERMVREDGRALLAYARALTGDAQDAEDAVQNALSRVAGSRVPFIGNLRAYVFKSVRNAALNALRARTRRCHWEKAAALEVFPIFQNPATRCEEVAGLNEALALLSEEQREVVLMKVWGGLSLSEIGEVAGIPRDTAASRYRCAIKRLRECMKEFIDEQ